MPTNRPKIRAALRRRVLVEAGHRCAILTCRHIEVEVHHIVPWYRVKRHNYSNLIALCPNCHRMAERGEIDRKSLRMYKANLRFAHDKFSQFELDLLFALHECPDDVHPFPGYLRLLIKRLLDAEYVTLEPLGPRSEIVFPDRDHLAVTVSPDRLRISTAGREFVDSLKTENL